MSISDRSAQRIQRWERLVKATEPWCKATVTKAVTALRKLESYWAFPGDTLWTQVDADIQLNKTETVSRWVTHTLQDIQSNAYKKRPLPLFGEPLQPRIDPEVSTDNQLSRTQCSTYLPYFEVLMIHQMKPVAMREYIRQLSSARTANDEFAYQVCGVQSSQAAQEAIMSNDAIQACLIYASESMDPIKIASSIHALRPSIDLYCITDDHQAFTRIEYRRYFKRMIYVMDSFLDLHYAILTGIRDRFETPFFSAIQAYSRKPKGVFHALPISRGSSIINSDWLADVLDVYGKEVFLTETSATHGGLDSLLDPRGPIKQAQDKAAQCFGAHRTYFVTNGTSTSNKIVTQSVLKPGDIALISSDCHKSISYSILLSGAYPVFLPTYPINQYEMYGAVELRTITNVLLELKRQGQLERVKLLILTNSTFDGIIYNVEEIMMAVLKIKPDIVFHWDEAWFAFAHFSPIYQKRSAMAVVQRLRERLQIPIRVYATQSTHKTLTSFRQGSMIHVSDDAFNADLFLEAFYTHTSTSPNYQIIASLDFGRRQVHLEGFRLVKQTIELALTLRKRVSSCPQLSRYFTVLTEAHLGPSHGSPLSPTPTEIPIGSTISESWNNQAFVIDPTRVTIEISQTGMDGTTFQQLLINRYDIQVNKTSKNAVLFIVNIGTTKQTIMYLLDVLGQISAEIDQSISLQGPQQQLSFKNQVSALSDLKLSLPKDRVFHPRFTPYNIQSVMIGDIRTAYFLGYDAANIQYRLLDNNLLTDVQQGTRLISAAFVTPYPPGFPILVPGQQLTEEILTYLIKLKIKEIHGLNPSDGLKLLTNDCIMEAPSNDTIN